VEDEWRYRGFAVGVCDLGPRLFAKVKRHVRIRGVDAGGSGWQRARGIISGARSDGAKAAVYRSRSKRGDCLCERIASTADDRMGERRDRCAGISGLFDV